MTVFRHNFQFFCPDESQFIYKLVVGPVSIVDVKYRHMSCILANITRAGEKESLWNLSLCMDDMLAWTNVSYQVSNAVLHTSLKLVM